MEKNYKTIEYVLYEQVKTNENIQKISRLSNSVKILQRTKNGVVIKEIIDFTPFKYCKSLNELSNSLLENEYLVIDLTALSLEKIELAQRIKESLDSTKIIQYVEHNLTNETDKSNKKFIPGEKVYALPYNYIKQQGVSSSNFPTIKIELVDDNLYDWGVIYFLSASYAEYDELLQGGYSGLYYKIPESLKDELEETYELTKVADGKWECKKYEKNKQR